MITTDNSNNFSSNDLCQLLKEQDINDFFHFLYYSKHYIYVFLDNLPIDKFVIIRTYTYNSTDSVCNKTNCFTITEFYANVGYFNVGDRFRLMLNVPYKDSFHPCFISYIQELIVEKLIMFYHDMLKYLCEKRLRGNVPLRLTSELVRKYDLTHIDTDIVEVHLKRYNAKAITRLQVEYDALKSLECIEK